MKKIKKTMTAFLTSIVLLSQMPVYAEETTVTTTAPAEETITVTAGNNEIKPEPEDIMTDASDSKESVLDDESYYGDVSSFYTETALSESENIAVAETTANPQESAIMMRTALFADGNIHIDGYFDDWEDKPMSPVYYYYSEQSVNYMSLYRDAENIYIYVKLNQYLSFGHTLYTFSYDGNYVGFYIIGSLKVNETTPFTIRSQNNYQTVANAYGYGYKQDNQPQVAEFVIPISAFGSNVIPDEVHSISVQVSDYGPQSIACSGTSTAPLISTGIGALFVCGSLMAYKKKKRNRF